MPDAPKSYLMSVNNQTRVGNDSVGQTRAQINIYDTDKARFSKLLTVL